MPLLKLFWNICLLRQGPQDVPASALLLRVVMLAYFSIGILLSVIETPLWEAIQQASADLLLNVTLVTSLLWMAGRRQRWLQTLTALLGSDSLISLFGLPVVGLFATHNEFAAPLWLGLLGWHLVVVAHILRLALDQRMWVGFIISALYTVLAFQAMYVLFPSAA